MTKLVLLRHGESAWNLENRFTGWTDVDLSPHGIQEAHEAGRILRAEGYGFDCAFTSVLKRAVRTLWLVLDEMDLMWLPVIRDWRLNERHYGALQGLNKAETAAKYGKEQVHLWRRSFSVRPPELGADDPRLPYHEGCYAHLDRAMLPRTESLEDTMVRTLRSWEETIAPRVRNGERVLVVAHGNSLRGLVKYLDNISDEDIPALNIPTGVPLVYEFEEGLRVRGHYYLGEPEKVQAATAAVAGQANV